MPDFDDDTKFKIGVVAGALVGLGLLALIYKMTRTSSPCKQKYS